MNAWRRAPLGLLWKSNEAIGMRQRAGGARLAVNSNNFFFNSSCCVNKLCKYFDAAFWVLAERHPDAMERVVGTPNKVHPPTLNTIPHLWYTFQLWNRMTGAEIKGQKNWSQKRALVPKAVFDLYIFIAYSVFYGTYSILAISVRMFPPYPLIPLMA